MKTRMKITIVTIVGMCMGVTAQNEVSTYFQVNADNSNGYVASKIYLKSHSNDRGTGLFTLGQTNNWFIGNPYTDHANSFMIGVSNKSDGIDPVAQKSFAKFYLNKDGEVGIGTTTPSAKLEVKGDGVFNATDDTNGIALHIRNTQGNNSFTFRGFTTKGQLQAQNSLPFEIKETYGKTWFYGSNGGNVGIGTTSPDKQLTVNSQIKILKSGNARTQGDKAELIFGEINSDFYSGSIRLENTISNPGSVNPKMVFSLQDVNSYTPDKVKDRMTILSNGNVGIGTADTKGFKLGVDGRVAATEVKVASYANWSDFVFEKEYKLPTLIEVEKHIKEKGHLKDIPSAKDVEKNGFFLGEMDAKLLQKIEELTLYTLKQEKKLNSQSKEIKALKQQNSKIAKQEKELKELKILVKRLLEK
ncbi:hypothetical protein [Tenacibaculum halocynthiae]|uniref:hypothetical protein n=1 Tax=Tenacibaculum halocynthiae TaxID=1254437 RepID=UPI003894CC6F